MFQKDTLFGKILKLEILEQILFDVHLKLNSKSEIFLIHLFPFFFISNL